MRNQVYASLVRQILEYARCVLDPHQRKHIKQLESVQRHAARFTTQNYYSMNPGCVTNMVTQPGWDLLLLWSPSIADDDDFLFNVET